MGWDQGFKMGSDMYSRAMDERRQEELAAQNKQLFDIKMADVARANAERDGLIQASKPAVVSEEAATLDTGSGAKVYDMAGGADVAASDARQFRGMQESTTGEAAPLPQVQPGKFTVNGKEYADKGGMQAAAATYNSPEARTQRQAAVYDTSGNLMQAEAIRSNANKSKLEGYQVSEAQTKHENRLINEALDKSIRESPDQWSGMAEFTNNSQAGWLAGIKVRAQQSSDGKTMRFVGTLPDGTEKPSKTYDNTDEGFSRARTDFMAMDPASRSQLVAEQHKNDRADKKTDAEVRHLNAQSGKEDAYAGYLSSGGAAGAKAANSGQSNDMSEIDTITLKNINRDRDFIHQARTKAMAEGSYQAGSDGAKALDTQLAVLNQKERVLQERYAGQSGSNSPDPLGVRKQASPQGVSPTRVTTQKQAANDSDRSSIMNNELKAARARLASGDSRAQADIDGLLREISRLPASQGQMQQEVTPVQQQSQTPVTMVDTAQALPKKSTYSYASSMEDANKSILARQLASKAKIEADRVAQEARDVQDKAVEEKRKRYLASVGQNIGPSNLMGTQINFSR